jgi:surfeit locus 1 family protein
MIKDNLKKIPNYLLLLGVISLCFIYLFVKLALWQLARADEKREILYKINNNKTSQSIIITDIKQLINIPEYTKVSLSGYFDNQNTVFLTNQFHNHQSGFHVVTPFILKQNLHKNFVIPADRVDPNSLENKSAILINRGWVPEIAIPATNNKIITITGIVKNSNNNQYIMGENISKLANKIYIQKISPELFSLKKLYTYPIADKYLRLITPSDQGYILNWQWTNMTPEKHFGYAIQWILLAIAVVLLYSCLCYNYYKSK